MENKHSASPPWLGGPVDSLLIRVLVETFHGIPWSKALLKHRVELAETFGVEALFLISDFEGGLRKEFSSHPDIEKESILVEMVNARETKVDRGLQSTSVPLELVPQGWTWATILSHEVSPGLVVHLGGLGKKDYTVIGDEEEGFRKLALVLTCLWQQDQQGRLERDIHYGVQEALLRVDLTGRILWVNPGTLRLSGYEKKDLVGHRIFRFCDDDSVAKGRAMLRRKLEGEVDQAFYEVAFCCAGDRWIRAECTSSLIGGHGRPMEILVSARDVSDRVKLEEELLQAQKMEAIGRLAGGIAHDFNNLLTVINGFTELLKSSLAPDAPEQQELSEVAHAGRRAAELTEHLLTFSRKQIVRPRLVSVVNEVRRSVGMLSRLIGEDVRIQLNMDSDLPQVKLDPAQFEQVVMNLVVNARDAMPRGGLLKIRARRESIEDSRSSVPCGEWILLEIQDYGIGMHPEVKQQIFEPFFTTKEETKGTGLGLATVYGVIRQAKGHIVVDSELGRGSIFRIYLPVAESEKVLTREPRREHWSAGSSIGRILVVEDEPAVKSLTEKILSKRGFQVVSTTRFEDALTLVKGEIFDLLVTDVVMPGMSGTELAARIRTIQPEISVLFMSGYSSSFSGERDFSAFLDGGFLSKPFSPEELISHVEELLDLQEEKGLRP